MIPNIKRDETTTLKNPRRYGRFFGFFIFASLLSVFCLVMAPSAFANPPTANPDYYLTTEKIPLNIAAPGVLDNDTDPNPLHIPLTVLSVDTSATRG